MSTIRDTRTEQSPAAGGDAIALDPRRWLALAVFAAAVLMVVLDTSIVNIASPQAQRDLGITDADRPWVVTACTLAFGGLLLLGGRIADLLGRRRVLLLGLVGFTATSALEGLAPDPVLFAARALQGVFAALLAPAALSLISVTFTDERERARAFGVYGAVGLVLGGLLTEYAGWRWCLWVLALDGVEADDAVVVLLNVTQQTGGAIGTAVLNTAYTATAAAAVTAGSATHTAHLAGYRVVFAVAAGLFAAAVVVLLARRTTTIAA